jgi:hypothetical protein
MTLPPGAFQSVAKEIKIASLSIARQHVEGYFCEIVVLVCPASRTRGHSWVGGSEERSPPQTSELSRSIPNSQFGRFNGFGSAQIAKVH